MKYNLVEYIRQAGTLYTGFYKPSYRLTVYSHTNKKHICAEIKMRYLREIS